MFFDEDSNYNNESTNSKTVIIAAPKRNKIVEQLIANQIAKSEKEKGLNSGECTPAHKKLRETMQQLRQLNDEIQTKRKNRVFDDDITQEELDIIQQRVALQQQQFKLYEESEFDRRYHKIISIWEYLSVQEVKLALKEASNDEETVMLNLSTPRYLYNLRKQLASKNTREMTLSMTHEQRLEYERLLAKRSNEVQKTTTSDVKRRQKLARLKLDDALDQNNFEGWSKARITAYKQIETKPNSYYYRFNAPGEKQRNGPWTEEEKKLFKNRLNEMGADGQWGIFSMAIPGRVGYQCSNYYRHQIKTRKIIDPNYFIDEKGGIHYLFGKKDGQVGTIRTHRTHGTVDRENKPPSSKRKRNNAGGDDGLDDDDGDDDILDQTRNNENSTTTTTNTTTTTTRKSSRNYSKNVVIHDDDDDEDGTFTIPSMEKRSNSNNNNNNNNTSSTGIIIGSSSSSSGDGGGTKRTSSRRGSIKSGEFNNSNSEQDQKQDEDEVSYEEHVSDPNNPLPGFIDPITLDEVYKPAISPYGHVMGYDSWLRCLLSNNNDENMRNRCPLTKKPLKKRELVVLTFENIEEYRDQIVNM